MERERKNPERVLVPVLLIVIAALLALFLGDIIVPFVRLELRNDLAGAEALLRSRGALGFLAVTLVEALQMVVIFIPAEFIQISSGLSYPFWLALLLCDLGVCMGASIIFVLVRQFRFRSSAFEKRRGKIERLGAAAHQRNTVLFMYLLFFMPIIPFGAICYYGSGTALGYGKYIRTVATGVVPSIIVSNLMGAAGMAFLVRGLPLWLLIVILVLLAAALFAVIALFLSRTVFKESAGTPDSPVYALCFALGSLWAGRKPKLEIEDSLLAEAACPYVMLVNHESFFDFVYVHRMAHPKNPSYLINDHICTRPVLKTLKRQGGFLGKKLFTPDLSAPLGIRRMLRAGYPVVIFPEGRLSPDGRSNPIVEEGAAFYRRLNADLVLTKIRGAYFAGPKWRRRRYHGRARVKLTVERVLKADELRAMSDGELNGLIAATLWNDASEDALCAYPQRGKAKGLETILYRCCDCGGLYTLRSRGNTLRCTRCGGAHTLDERYHFTTAPFTIPAWYDAIREMERREPIALECAVRTVVFPPDGGRTRREEGTCSLDPEGFTYRSDKISFTIPAEKLPALAFSCGTEFELYYGGEQYYFYPKEHPEQTARWALAADLLAEERRNEGVTV